jgi:drug/metabolite transporter (DMT)-like permease
VRLGILAVLWGTTFLFIKISLGGLSPVQMVCGRMLFGTALLFLVLVWRRERFWHTPHLFLHLGVASAVANLAPYFLFAWAEQRVDSSLAGTLNSTTPLFTLLLAYLTRTERGISLSRISGLIVGFAGAVLVVAPWRADVLAGSVSGELASLGAAACYGIGYVYMRRFLTGRGLSPLALATSQLAVGTSIIWAVGPVVANTPIHLSAVVLLSTLALGVLGTGMVYLLTYRLIQDEGATSASTVTYLLPVVAVVLGILVLGEPVSWNLLVGAPVVLLGVSLSENRLSLSRLRARRSSESAQRVA